MAAKINPFLALAQQYDALLHWDGDLLVHTIHSTAGAKTYRVLVDEVMDITEVGVLIGWRGVAPTGKIIPWSEITLIEQAEPGSGSEEE